MSEEHSTQAPETARLWFQAAALEGSIRSMKARAKQFGEWMRAIWDRWRAKDLCGLIQWSVLFILIFLFFHFNVLITADSGRKCGGWSVWSLDQVVSLGCKAKLAVLLTAIPCGVFFLLSGVVDGAFGGSKCGKLLERWFGQMTDSFEARRFEAERASDVLEWVFEWYKLERALRLYRLLLGGVTAAASWWTIVAVIVPEGRERIWCVLVATVLWVVFLVMGIRAAMTRIARLDAPRFKG